MNNFNDKIIENEEILLYLNTFHSIFQWFHSIEIFVYISRLAHSSYFWVFSWLIVTCWRCYSRSWFFYHFKAYWSWLWNRSDISQKLLIYHLHSEMSSLYNQRMFTRLERRYSFIMISWYASNAIILYIIKNPSHSGCSFIFWLMDCLIIRSLIIMRFSRKAESLWFFARYSRIVLYFLIMLVWYFMRFWICFFYSFVISACSVQMIDWLIMEVDGKINLILYCK